MGLCVCVLALAPPPPTRSCGRSTGGCGAKRCPPAKVVGDHQAHMLAPFADFFSLQNPELRSHSPGPRMLVCQGRKPAAGEKWGGDAKLVSWPRRECGVPSPHFCITYLS